LETRANFLFVGLIVGTLLLALLGSVVWMIRPDPDGVIHQILFERSVDGLEAGSAVTLSGVRVGYVQSVGIAPDDPERVRVLISLEKEASRLPGLQASIESSFVSNEARVVLESSSDPSRPGTFAGASGIPTIPARGGTGLLAGNSQGVMESVFGVAERLNGALTPSGIDKAGDKLAQIEAATSRVATAAPTYGERARRLERLLERYGRKAERLRGDVETVDRRLSGNGANGALAEPRASLARARDALADIETEAGKARQTIHTASSQIEGVNEVLRDVRSDIEPVRRTLEQVEQQGLIR
jgi:phospholipid/cholesterol/gamma-HCH transport system substrate-binding protein